LALFAKRKDKTVAVELFECYGNRTSDSRALMQRAGGDSAPISGRLHESAERIRVTVEMPEVSRPMYFLCFPHEQRLFRFY
jgi:hypothetical protein